ncbi:ROK family protein [Carboxydochorda subterranea]|uniref:ROK family protein n=1 Tax=Carboxydichorda subterranea TaxID=3109565 RepID=A0ABZ1C558_9FIRM|nr:ROK family protein [Limnochorda sp. L945t]WRP18943.1 ROK family protein [Limnochorda sp. L945t]
MDIGGTRLRGACVTAQGQILERLEQPVVSPDDGNALTRQVVELVSALARISHGQSRADVQSETVAISPSAVGVSLPAVIDRVSGRVLRAPHLPGWDGSMLSDQLAQELGLPVVLEYDGHAAALGEQWLGAGRGVDNFVCLVIGTGFGGGIIADGRLLRGYTNLAGVAGWMGIPTSRKLDEPTLIKVGVLEALVAGPGIERIAAESLQERLSCKEVFDHAEAGDQACQAIVREVLQHLAWGLANVVALINPELVLLGGSVGLRMAVYSRQLESAIRRYSPSWSSEQVRVGAVGLGGDSGLIGAAMAALRHVSARQQ